MFTALLLAATVAPGHFVERVVTLSGVDHRYQVWIPAAYDAGKQWPAILFLHGAGERGNDGGTGTWILAVENPQLFSAIAPVCGWVSAPPPFRTVADPPAWLWNAPDRFDAVARRVAHIPTWILHGGLDNVVPPEESRQMIARLDTNAAYTEFPMANHNAWDPAYRMTSVIAWLTRQSRK